MNISFEKIEVGKKYHRRDLTKIWKYLGIEAIQRGIVTPRNSKHIILFVTKNNIDPNITYLNTYRNDVLTIEGEKHHQSDKRLISSNKNNDNIHLFYRKESNTLFSYEGIIFLKDYIYNENEPSIFTFAKKTNTALSHEISETLVQEDLHIDNLEKEGEKTTSPTKTHHRSQKNRKLAIEKHGITCKACGFNFNVFYGKKLAQDFIQIHHTISITEIEGKTLSIDDLVPLCANCHNMVHRQKNEILSIDKLKEIIQSNNK